MKNPSFIHSHYLVFFLRGFIIPYGTNFLLSIHLISFSLMAQGSSTDFLDKWGQEDVGLGKNQRGTFELCCCCCCWVASVMSDSVRPHRRQPTRLLCLWDSPGKNTGVGCHFLLFFFWAITHQLIVKKKGRLFRWEKWLSKYTEVIMTKKL